MTLMQMRNVSFAYEDQPVLKNVSFDLQPGEFLGIIGPNGSGKSTLLKLLGGMLASAKGEIFFKDTPLRQCKRRALAQSISWIPQDHPMVFPFKVSEIVLMGRHPYLSALSFEGQNDFDIARNAMELTQTLQFSERGFNEISGGEKQRVVIASAIAQEPEVMLLDEPTSALDIKYQMQVLKILRNLNRDNGITQVLAMHDLHLASKFCNRLLLLKNGEIVRDGSPEDVLQKDVLENVYGVKVKLFRDESDGSILVSPEA